MPRALGPARRLCRVVLLQGLCLVSISISISALTPSQSDTKGLAQQADRRIGQLQAEADRLATQTRTLLNALTALEVQRAIKVQEVRKANAELSAVSASLKTAAERLAALEAERLAGTPGVRERLIEIYKRGRGGYVRLLLASDDIRALGRLSRGVAAIAQLDRARFEAHRRTVRAEREAVKDLETRRSAVAMAEAEARKARLALDAAAAAQNSRIDELDRRRDLTAQYVGELQQAQAELQRRVTSITPDAGAALPLAPFRGALDWPVTGRVLSRFGRGSGDRSGTPIVRNGIEVAALEGQEVRGVHGGTVAYAAPFTGFGTLVILDHGDGAFTLYGHLSEASVEPGARVAAHAIIGRSGRSPAGVPALYFELRIDGRPVDPVQWLRRN